MEIPPKAIEQLRQVHKKRTGEDLTDQEALEMAQKLFELVMAVYKPIPPEYIKKHKDEFPELYQQLVEKEQSNTEKKEPEPPQEKGRQIGFRV